MQIRVLTPADAADYQRVRLLALKLDPLAFIASHDEECDTPLAEVARQLQAGPQRAVVGAFDGDTLVGTCAWRREQPAKLAHKGYVWGVYVAASHRGQGLARRMLEELIAHARRAPGVRQLNLSVYASNAGAVALYASMGFEVYGREPAAVLLDGVLHEDVHMVKVLQEQPS